MGFSRISRHFAAGSGRLRSRVFSKHCDGQLWCVGTIAADE
jgi:hypothetical protein